MWNKSMIGHEEEKNYKGEMLVIHPSFFFPNYGAVILRYGSLSKNIYSEVFFMIQYNFTTSTTVNWQ